MALASAASFYARVFIDMEYHVQESRLERFAWFRRKRQLHYSHHLHANSNFAVIDFFWDTMLGTYRKPGEDIRLKYGLHIEAARLVAGVSGPDAEAAAPP